MTVFLCPVPFVKLPGGAPPVYYSKGAIIAQRLSFDGASVDVAYPAVVSAGHIAVMVMLGTAGGGINIGGAGPDDVTWDHLATGTDSDQYAAKLWWRECAGTEGGTTSLLNTDGAATDYCAQIFTFDLALTGADPTQDPSAAIANFSSSFTSNATTVSIANSLGVRIYCQFDNITSTPPSGWTENSEDQTSPYIDFLIAIDTKIISSAGTEAASTRTVTGGPFGIIFDFALKPRT